MRLPSGIQRTVLPGTHADYIEEVKFQITKENVNQKSTCALQGRWVGLQRGSGYTLLYPMAFWLIDEYTVDHLKKEVGIPHIPEYTLLTSFFGAFTHVSWSSSADGVCSVVMELICIT